MSVLENPETLRRTRRLPPNYGSSLYESWNHSPRHGAHPHQAQSPSFSPEDSRLRSWLHRRRKAVGDVKGDDPDPVASGFLASQHQHASASNSKALHRPFKWVPIQALELAADDTYFRGAHVNSLSPILKPGPEIHWTHMDTTKAGKVSELSCCLVGSKMVFCRGLVKCLDATPGVRIAQLPPSMLPSGTLTFAVLCDGPEEQGLSLGRLKVARDGWLYVESVKCGCLIDLGGVRFAIGGGLPLAESVQVFACNLSSQRLVMLQGMVSEKVFDLWPGDPLIKLPPDFKPPATCPFVVPGARSGGFHLIDIAPSLSGGHLCWRDSVWNRDEIELTGVTYELNATGANLGCLPSALIGTWSSARRNIVISDFHKFVASKFGSLESAWEAYNVYGDGQVDFKDFTEGCKIAKFSGNICRLWSMLDVQKAGIITYEEFLGSCSNGSPSKTLTNI